jgi:hypothetical protein
VLVLVSTKREKDGHDEVVSSWQQKRVQAGPGTQVSEYANYQAIGIQLINTCAIVGTNPDEPTDNFRLPVAWAQSREATHSSVATELRSSPSKTERHAVKDRWGTILASCRFS